MTYVYFGYIKLGFIHQITSKWRGDGFKTPVKYTIQ